jgi:hypothetical protein
VDIIQITVLLYAVQELKVEVRTAKEELPHDQDIHLAHPQAINDKILNITLQETGQILAVVNLII